MHLLWLEKVEYIRKKRQNCDFNIDVEGSHLPSSPLKLLEGGRTIQRQAVGLEEEDEKVDQFEGRKKERNVRKKERTSRK